MLSAQLISCHRRNSHRFFDGITDNFNQFDNVCMWRQGLKNLTFSYKLLARAYLESSNSE